MIEINDKQVPDHCKETDPQFVFARKGSNMRGIIIQLPNGKS